MATSAARLEPVDDRVVATVGTLPGTLRAPLPAGPRAVARSRANPANELPFVAGSNAIRHMIRGGHAMMLVPGLEPRGRVALRAQVRITDPVPSIKDPDPKPAKELHQV